MDFVNDIKDKFLKDKKADRNLPLLGELATRPTIDQIEKAVQCAVGGNEGLSKQVKLFFLTAIAEGNSRKSGHASTSVNPVYPRQAAGFL